MEAMMGKHVASAKASVTAKMEQQVQVRLPGLLACSTVTTDHLLFYSSFEGPIASSPLQTFMTCSWSLADGSHLRLRV